MEIVDGRTIKGECLQLDDKHFINCMLVNCVLEYRGHPVIFDRTIMRGCRHVFYGQARRTLHYLQGVGLMPHDPAQWGEFSDQVN